MDFVEKMVIAKQIKNITYADAIEDFKKLQKYEYRGKKSITGTKTIDFFTFVYRLDTQSKHGMTFYEFLKHIDFYRNKHAYIDSFINNNEHIFTGTNLIWHTFKLYMCGLSSFNASTAVGIYKTFNPTSILDPFSGWGGRLIGAMASDIAYTGYDTNPDIRYNLIIDTLRPFTLKNTKDDKYRVFNQPAETADFSLIKYDMVLTSPPYYNIETYVGTDRKTKDEWNALYRTVFKNAYDNMDDGGTFCLSINAEMYKNVFEPLLGECADTTVYTQSRRCKYGELLYIWIK